MADEASPNAATASDRTRRYFENQAKACDRLGSPFTAKVCRSLGAALDQSTRTGRRILHWKGDAAADALALRLCGGLHALALSGADGDLAAIYPPNVADDAMLAKGLASAVERNDAMLAHWLEQPPQTNEIGRSAMLMPGLLAIARETALPLALNEIGSSAGLNLLFDRFHYRYGGSEWGDPASPVQLAPEVVGSIPPLDGDLAVVSRHGSDITPVDIADPQQRLRLKSFIWADQTQRLARMDAALALAEIHPFKLEQADAADFVQRRLAERPGGSTFVLMHSIMWQYLPAGTQARIENLMAEAGRHAIRPSPLAWLRMEPLSLRDPHATLSLTLWPGGETRELAKCDYHGRWIEWLG